MKRIIYFLFFFCAASGVKAQIDNAFWFVAPEVAQSHGDRPIFMRISTMADTANIVLRMPACPSFTPVTQKIIPNSTYSKDLTSWIDSIENQPADQVLNRGLLLTSDNYITAYYEVANGNNPAVSSLKGKNALGTEFYISGQTDFYNQVGSEVFDIVATEDNTHIWITPALAIVGHAKGVTFEVVLNKGQTYSARTPDVSATASLAGSHVVSDKPVAITIMDDSIHPPGGSYDEIADQTIPVNILGSDYIVIKGFATNVTGNNDEHAFILAIKDSTDIYVNGNAVPITTLNAGSQYDYSIPPSDNTVKISATKPVYVYHLSGNGSELGSAIIPQDSCTGSREIGFTRSTPQEFALLILTRSGNEGSFLMNGNNSIILPSDFSVVPGSGGSWMYYRKTNIPVAQVPVGGNQIVNTSGKFHLGILNRGSGGSSEYGYFSDFSSLYLGTDRNICPGDSLVLDGGMNRASYEWRKDSAGVWVTVDTSRFLVVRDSGSYAVMTNGDFCELRDTIHVGTYTSPHPALGNDTTLCQGASITLDPGLFTSYHWQNGFTGRYYTTGAPGLYRVEVTNNNGCKASDSILIVVDSLPKTTGVITGLSTVCQGQVNLTYSVPLFPFAASYIWTIPPGCTGSSSSNSITLDFGTSAISDTLKVKGHNNCGNSAEIKLPVNVNPLPGAAGTIGGPGFICEGQTGIDYFVPAITNATSYLWSFPSGVSIISGGGTNIVTINPSAGASSGNITVRGNNSCGNGPASSLPLVIGTSPLPTITGSAVVCQNSANNYKTQAGMTGYIWNVSAGGNIVAGGTPTDSSVTVKWTSVLPQSLSVGYTTTAGCSSIGFGVYNVSVKPSPVIANPGSSSVCSPGATSIFLQSTPPGASFSWMASGSSPSVTGFSNSSGPAITQLLHNSGFFTETVTYTVTPDLNSCIGTPSDFVVSVFPVPDVLITPNGQSICSGTSTGLSLHSGVASASFTWTASAGSGNVNGYSPGGGQSIDQVLNNTGTMAESVTYSVTPHANLCDGLMKPISVQVFPLPAVFFNSCIDQVTTTAGAPIILKGGVPTGGSYSGTGVVTGMFNPGIAGTGTFNLTYTYQNTWGCSSNASHPISVVSPPAFICGNTFADPRDNKIYPTVKFGTQCWMASNLNYGTAISSGQIPMDNCLPEKYCFNDNAAFCSSYGGLYTWDEMMQYSDAPSAQGLCPPGWHIPFESEWTVLFNQFNGNGLAASALKTTGFSTFDITTNEGLRLKYAVWGFDNFATMLWSSSAQGPDKAWAHGLNLQDPSVSSYPASRSNAFVIRCIKD